MKYFQFRGKNSFHVKGPFSEEATTEKSMVELQRSFELKELPVICERFLFQDGYFVRHTYGFASAGAR